MSVYYTDESVTLHHGDCRTILPTLPAASVDAIVTDPPYGLEFMGKNWDAPWKGEGVVDADAWNQGASNAYSRARIRSGRGESYGHSSASTGQSFQVWCETWAAECLRVLKPGGHLLAFGGTRTYHRMTCAVEDAGFEIRDGITWLYGSGFPKNLDVSKAIDKAAGATREVVGHTTAGASSLERVRRVEMGYRDNLTACNPTAIPVTVPATEDAATWAGWGTALKPSHEPIVVARKPLAGTVAANVLTHGTGALNIAACRVGTTRRVPASHSHSASTVGATGISGKRQAPELDPDIGRWPSNVVFTHTPGCDAGPCTPGCPVAELDAQSGALTSGANPTRHGSDKFRDAYGDFAGQAECAPARGADAGGASQFFPTFRYEAKAPTVERPRDGQTAHPTVKPLDLMRWLVRLVTPPGGLVLDPFAGSGTTAEACVIEGFRCTAIEANPPYLPLIVARLSKPIPLAMFGD